MTPENAELYREWKSLGLLHVLRDAPAYMRTARLQAGKNDLALLAVSDTAGEVTWRWYTRIELLCAVIDQAPWAEKTVVGLGEERPDPSKFPVLVTHPGAGLMLAIIDMTDAKESVGLN